MGLTLKLTPRTSESLWGDRPWIGTTAQLPPLPKPASLVFLPQVSRLSSTGVDPKGAP